MKIFRTALWVLIAGLAVVMGWLTYTWQVNENESAGKPYGVPFELVDQAGAPITEAAFRDRPTALFFGFTNCPDVCPTTLFELDGWLKQIDPEGGRIGAYLITVDPERDTPDVLSAYVTGITDRVIGITGTPDSVAEVLKGFNVYSKKSPDHSTGHGDDYSMDHTSSILLLDAKGRLRDTITWGENPDRAAAKLKKLL